MKENATVTRRELVKQFVNNLYGTMNSSTETSFNVAYDKGFYTHPENNKLPVPFTLTLIAYNVTFQPEEITGLSVPSGVLLADTDYKMR